MFSFLTRSIKSAFGQLDERLSSYRQRTTELGRRGTELSQQKQRYGYDMPDFELAAVIAEIRAMDRAGGEIKRIHNKVSGSLTKGGLLMDNPKSDPELAKLWKGFTERTQLNKRLKLISDARGLIVTGSLPLQWVLDEKKTMVVRCIQMPTETIRPIVGVDGQFKDPKQAFAQYSSVDGNDLAYFARWQLDIARLDPDNFDDMGALGRPMLDAVRKKWRQVDRSGDDMVIRRGTRAAMRTAHFIDGATDDQLAEYKKQVESEEGIVTSNYYSNKKGAVETVQGDENLDQIADVTLLMDSMYAGTPIPKGLLGYVDGLSRDVLQDMKNDFYEELDTLQDSLADVYSFGFKLELLLKGINPDDKDFTIRFGERLTETLTQKTDRALKIMALGASRQSAWSTAGLDHDDELERLEDERANADVYPMIDGIPGVDDELENAGDRPVKGQHISITPNQGGGKDSATNINN